MYPILGMKVLKTRKEEEEVKRTNEQQEDEQKPMKNLGCVHSDQNWTNYDFLNNLRFSQKDHDIQVCSNENFLPFLYR